MCFASGLAETIALREPVPVPVQEPPVPQVRELPALQVLEQPVSAQEPELHQQGR